MTYITLKLITVSIIKIYRKPRILLLFFPAIFCK